MSLIKSLIILVLITLSLNQSQNETEKTEKINIESNDTIKSDEIKIEEENTDDLNETINETSHIEHTQRPEYDKNHPFNLTEDEMDKMMFCTLLIQETLRTKRTQVEQVQKNMNLSSPNPVYEKVGTDIFEKCNNNADIKDVHMYIKNLSYYDNFKWNKKFEPLVDIDFDKYSNESNLRLTMNQQFLMYKYQKVDELFRQKRADQRDKIDRENQKIKIGKFDMDSIPNSIKFSGFLLVLIVIFGGIFYFLKKLEKKPKEKKKNKKKKTQ
jgi:hypothetical protein